MKIFFVIIASFAVLISFFLVLFNRIEIWMGSSIMLVSFGIIHLLSKKEERMKGTR